MIAVNEVLRRHSFFSFGLEFENFKRSILSAADKQLRTFCEQLSLRNLLGSGSRNSDVQRLPPKESERSGPGLESAQPVVDFPCGAAKVDPAIFFLQNRRKTCVGVILWARSYRSRLKSAKSLYHQFRSHRG